jgi:hypothetical protein
MKSTTVISVVVVVKVLKFGGALPCVLFVVLFTQDSVRDFMRKALFVIFPLCGVISANVLIPLTVRSAMAQGTAPKQAQCRALFEVVVDSRNMDGNFYARKAATIRSLPLSDGKLQTLQSRFATMFGQMAGNRNASSAQANPLVNELSRYCFRP